ncbi:hypothetical protein WJX77_010531 [Trebouxia sp. C0004]
MKDAWVLGAVLTVVGSVGINLGTNLMKLGYMQRESLDLDNDVAIWRFWQWQTGMLMFVVGNIANFVARAFASQSLLTGLGSVQFISNLVFVVLVLREKVPRRCILATFLIVAGNVLLVVFGSKTSPKYTVSQLAALYRQDSMAAYMIMAYGGVVPLAFTLYLYGQQTKRLMPTRTFALWAKALPVLYALFSSILGAHAVLFATSLCIIIVDLIGGSDVFTEWYTYLVVIGIIGMSIFWVGQLDRGLLLFPAVVIVPMLEIQWVLFIMVSGGLYFGDFETFSKLQLAMFGVGVFVLLLGIFCLIPDARPEAPALEEALRTAGFGRDEAVFDNPAYIHSSDKSSSGIPRSKSGVIPASAARRIEVRPKRSSIAIVTDMGKQAKQSIFQSAVNTATLTAGMVSQPE